MHTHTPSPPPLTTTTTIHTRTHDSNIHRNSDGNPNGNRNLHMNTLGIRLQVSRIPSRARRCQGWPRALGGPVPWAAPPRAPWASPRESNFHWGPRGKRHLRKNLHASVHMGKSIVRMGSPWDSPCGYSLKSVWESAASPKDSRAGSKVPGLAPHPGQPRAPGGPAASPRELSTHGYLSA